MSTKLTLRNQDCVTGMGALLPRTVDLIVTSPPYNLGIKYSCYADTKSLEEYLLWTRRWAEAAFTVLTDNGSLFLNFGGSSCDPLLPHQVVIELSKLFVLQNTIHWVKSITVKTPKGGEISAGHFKPINSKRYLNNCHEYIFHLTKTGEKHVDRLGIGAAYSDKSNIARWSYTAGRDRRCRGNNWFVPYKTINSRAADRPHPSTFPVELVEMCARLHGAGSGTTMLDPFLGIGSSAVAARNLGVKEFIGFEIDSAYLDVARTR